MRFLAGRVEGSVSHSSSILTGEKSEITPTWKRYDRSGTPVGTPDTWTGSGRVPASRASAPAPHRGLGGMRAVRPADASALVLSDVAGWWERESASPAVQRGTYVALATVFGLIALVALLQLARIQMRVPEYGWTTQKVFHLLNALFAGGRAVTFAFFHRIAKQGSPAVQDAFWDLPGIVFFTTYSLLVLFWAEIFRQARSLPVGHLRPAFTAINLSVLVLDISLCLFSSLSKDINPRLGPTLSALFFAALSIIAAVAFCVYGGRLYFMLRRFPVESRGRRAKLREVGSVTLVCTAAFTVRAVANAVSALGPELFRLDVPEHPLLNATYYVVAEALPAATVLYILRRLPPRRQQLPGYQATAGGSVAVGDTLPVDSSAYSEGVRDRAAAPGVGGVREPLLGEGEDREASEHDEESRPPEAQSPV